MPAADSTRLLVPADVAERTGIVEFEIVDRAIVPELPAFEGGSWILSHIRRVLRKLGVLPPAPMGRNLAVAEQVAVRVTAADGSLSTVPIPDSVLRSSGDIWDYIASRVRATR